MAGEVLFLERRAPILPTRGEWGLPARPRKTNPRGPQSPSFEMKRNKDMRAHRARRTFVLAAVLAMMSFVPGFAKTTEDYKFKVFNNTKIQIKQILVSEDGKKWGFFDIGKGIAAGATIELVWASATNGSGCDWNFKAVWADGDESDPAEFDFCEKDLVIEFAK